ncbi:MAG: YbaB/EbfC family nucleoid-associated protein [Candidatus Marinimicrobia bacterium]|nr:YbaB/EbfC family nucleoid-associated protein [Candidatus Neomarinimicrobiota bacterium]
MFPKGNLMTSVFQQVKEVQTKIDELQGELAGLRIEGEAGGGMVKAVVNGQQELISVKIDGPALADDVELVEDLVTAAVNQALGKSRDESQERMRQITGGMLGRLNLPGS